MGLFDFVGDVVNGVTGYLGAQESAKIQKKALKQQKALSEQALNYQAPYRNLGETSTGALLNAVGLGNSEDAIARFQASPLYKLLYGDALKEGADDVTSLASSRGQLNSGATLKALQDNRVKTANNFFSQYLSGLGDVATRGQNAANASGNIAVGQGTATVQGAQGLADTSLAKYLGLGGSIQNGIGSIANWAGGMAGGGSSLYGQPNLGNVNRYTGMIGGGV